MFVYDGASYHKSPGTRLGISYVVAAPWGYDTMICEYWFSQFKSQQINPTREKTGKK